MAVPKPPTTPPPTPDEEHRAKERAFWERQLRIAEGLNRITFGAAAVGVVGLVVFFCQLAAMQQANRDAQKSFIDGNRGWISPFAAQPTIDRVSVMGFSITFSNVGKSPAQYLNWSTKTDTILPPPGLDWSKSSMSRNSTCDGLLPDHTKGGVIYPSVPGQVPWTRQVASDPPIALDNDIKSGKRLTFVEGCVAYETMGIVGRSGFCFAFQPMTSEKGVIKGEALQCSTGARAE